MRGERLREPEGVARLVSRGVDPTRQRCRLRGERGLDRQAFVLVADACLDAERAQRAHALGRLRKLGRAVEEMKNAALELVVLESQLRAQLAQLPPAPRGQRSHRARVAMGARRQALEQEARAPDPLRRIARRAELERRIVAPEPAQDLPWRPRVGPRFGMADRDLPAIGEARLARGLGLAVDQGDAKTGLLQVPRRRHTGQSGAENHDVHARVLRKNDVRGQGRASVVGGAVIGVDDTPWCKLDKPRRGAGSILPMHFCPCARGVEPR